MRALWTKESMPFAFERTEVKYATIPIKDLEDRQFLIPSVKAIIDHLPDGVWLAGSWFESLFRGETPKDFDLFFRDADAAYELIDLLKEPPEPESEDDLEFALDGYEFPDEDLLESLLDDEKTTAISLKHKTLPTIQIIRTRFYDSAEDVIDSFDFTACQFAIGKDGCFFNPNSMLDLMRKRLVVHRVTFPSSTVRRMIKYADKGYFACGGSLIELVEKIKNAPEQTTDVLYID